MNGKQNSYIVIDVLDQSGHFVAMDMVFPSEEKSIAELFLIDGFGATVEEKINVQPNIERWIARITEEV